ncbi:hypothetical protein [Indioceanicola profundi]|uniref:hypothetical protein n=1 Tax=Indioceanicola profundi TaxID=2220096 RepID=UPI000E6AD202|nr:hypothetical protein [Indioceanicola profundi]
MRRVVKTILLVLVAGGIGYGLGLFRVPEKLLAGNDEESSVPAINRRKDPETGCDAIADGIRMLVDTTRYSEPVKAQMLDGLLLNYRNLECGIHNRTRLLLELTRKSVTDRAAAPE